MLRLRLEMTGLCSPRKHLVIRQYVSVYQTLNFDSAQSPARLLRVWRNLVNARQSYQASMFTVSKAPALPPALVLT